MQKSKKDIEKFKENFRNSIENISGQAEKNQWVFRYDKISDILYFSAKEGKVSKDSVLLPIDDHGVSIRVSSKGSFESMMVEDFINVFVSENKEYSSLAKTIKWAPILCPIKKIFKKGSDIQANTNPKEYTLFYKSLLFDAGILKNDLSPLAV